MKAAIETAGHGTYGPFRDERTAADWANRYVSDATWRLIKLREPDGLTLEEMWLCPEAAR